MVGVEFVKSKETMKADPELRDKIEMACFERGLIILGCGANTIRWSPPLILSKENVDVALEIFRRRNCRFNLTDESFINLNRKTLNISLQYEILRLFLFEIKYEVVKMKIIPLEE
jgi:hypothetical protein